MRRHLSCSGPLVLLVALLHAAPVFAGPTAADKETARALLIDGRARLAAGDARAALKSFQAAHSIMRVPTTGLDVARAQIALGFFVEARTTALDIARIPVAPDEPPAFTAARAAAKQVADDLERRIPALVIHVHGGPADAEVHIRIDAQELPSAAQALPRKANPGEHTVEASASGYATARSVVTLKEGEALPVELTLAPDGSPRAPAPAIGGSAPVPPIDAAPPVADARPSGRRTAGFVVGGVGIAGLVLGGVMGGLALGQKGIIGDHCGKNAKDPLGCDATGLDAANSVKTLGLVSTIGFVAGGAGLVTGAVLLVTSRGPAKPAESGRGPWMSAGVIGVGPAGATLGARGAW